MTTPSHLSIARLEHAIVVNRRKYYCLHESGELDRAEQARLELDYLNLCYWKHHSLESPRASQVLEIESYKKVANGVEQREVLTSLYNGSNYRTYLDGHAHIPSFKDWIHEPVVDTSRNNGIFYDEVNSQ